jgi:hypothetical protein
MSFKLLDGGLYLLVNVRAALLDLRCYAQQPTNGYRKEIHINYAVHVLAH